MADTEVLQNAIEAAGHPTSNAMSAAELICGERNARFTFMRRAVFATLCEAGHPLSAYQIMDHLSRAFDKCLGPPTIYRALDFLLKHKLIARLESRNAFVVHVDPLQDGAGVFFICDHCGSAEALHDNALARLLRKDADTLGFEIGRQVVELQGTCAHCRDERDCPETKN